MEFEDEAGKGKLKSRLSLSRYSQAQRWCCINVNIAASSLDIMIIKSTGFETHPSLCFYLYHCCQVQIEKAILISKFQRGYFKVKH